MLSFHLFFENFCWSAFRKIGFASQLKLRNLSFLSHLLSEHALPSVPNSKLPSCQIPFMKAGTKEMCGFFGFLIACSSTVWGPCFFSSMLVIHGLPTFDHLLWANVFSYLRWCLAAWPATNYSLRPCVGNVSLPEVLAVPLSLRHFRGLDSEWNPCLPGACGEQIWENNLERFLQHEGFYCLILTIIVHQWVALVTLFLFSSCNWSFNLWK